MQVVVSLLSAIVRHDGDALVMHVGEQPVVMTASGPVSLTAGKMTLGSMDDLLRDLLPPAALQSLEEFGAVDLELPPAPALPGERFSVVAARGGDDIWIELRRRRGAAGVAAAASDAAGVPASDLERALAQATASSNPPVTGRADAGHAPPPARAAGSTNVLPLARTAVRPEAGGRAPRPPRVAGLERLLRLAAARGAETLYLFSQTRPSIRVDGEIGPVEGEPVLGQQDVEALLLDVMPDRREDAAGGAGPEWIVDVPDVGRVRCVSFRDHRGPGGIFRMIPAKALSAEQLGLSREIQQLCAEPEGLVVVAGPRSSGKSTLMGAFVDLVNRTRSDHVITLESRITVVHEARSSLVSQREVRGDAGELLAAFRAALRENPDVIVIEDLRSADVIVEALEAAAAGHLVIVGVPAQSSGSAIERLIEVHPPERRPHVQALVAETLRGVVSQVLLRKTGGGRVAARELLLASPSIAKVIADGRIAHLPAALESGRRVGMVPLADALVAFVQSGAVDVREAWRKAGDRPGLLKVLKREGIDTSFAERLA